MNPVKLWNDVTGRTTFGPGPGALGGTLLGAGLGYGAGRLFGDKGTAKRTAILGGIAGALPAIPDIAASKANGHGLFDPYPYATKTSSVTLDCFRGLGKQAQLTPTVDKLPAIGEEEVSRTGLSGEPLDAMGRTVKDPQGAVKPRKSIFIGPNSSIDAPEVEKYLQTIEKNTGNDLSKMPVLVNQQQVMRNLWRYYVPKTMRQVPSRAARGLTSLIPPIGIFHLLRAINNAKIKPNNFYHPLFGTVNITDRRPGTIAHEIGHFADLEQGKGFYKMHTGKHRPYPLDTKGYGRLGTLDDELNASLFAHKALPNRWGQDSKQLGLALSSYMWDRYPQLMIQKTWLRPEDFKYKDPKWRNTLQTKLFDPSENVRRKALQGAFNAVVKPENMQHFPLKLGKGETIRWTDPKSRKVVDLSRALLDTQYKHITEEKAKQDKAKEKQAHCVTRATKSAQWVSDVQGDGPPAPDLAQILFNTQVLPGQHISVRDAARTVMADPLVSGPQKAVAYQMLMQADADRNGLVTAQDLVRGAIGAGVGYTGGKLLSKIFSSDPATQRRAAQFGAIAGALNGMGILNY